MRTEFTKIGGIGVSPLSEAVTVITSAAPIVAAIVFFALMMGVPLGEASVITLGALLPASLRGRVRVSPGLPPDPRSPIVIEEER